MEFPKEEIEQSIPDRFERIVAAHSGRLAVKTNRAEFTYDELNRTANRVAHALLARHGSVEEPVLLLLDNGAPMIASIIGALKAAKIYVPLDPSFPILRHREILEDTAAGLIVADSNNLSLAAELAAGKLALVNIDELDPSASDDNPRPRAAPDTPAYILYTSGSTGKPKGVLQNHRNVLHLIMRHTNRGRVGPEDRIALLRSFGVHGGTYDTFAALLNGAAILPFDIKRQGMRELAKWLAREEITLCRIGPTPFRHLAQALGEADRFPRLRMLSFSGEPLHGNDIELCRRYFSPDCILVNSFGATEVSSCCEYIIDPKSRIENGAVPCGTAARDMKIYLIDDDGKEARPGEIGEIAVKSRYLALGYWKRPELTRAKFRPDPDGGEERVYLTGDLGRMLPGGRLLHVGRKDFQVKIRGYRVEAGEVEAALLALGNIKEAVAVARQDRERTSRLIAYLVPRKAPPPTVTALRRALAKKVPEHMIPSTFVFMDTLPLTPNGKVDRRALPEPSATRPKLQLPPVAPRNPTEKTTVDIWEAVLGVDQVGLHDNFFDLGGNSLLAAQIVSRVFDEFHIELPLQLMLEAPTVAALAQHIDTALRTVRGRGGPALKPTPRNARLPLSFAQQRLWFLDQLAPGNPAYHIPAALRLSGRLDAGVLEQSLQEIVWRHEALRTTFPAANGEPFQAIAPAASLPLAVIDLRELPEDRREAEGQRIVAEEARKPFDLALGPLARAHLLRLGEEEYILLLTMHHIVSDGWSRRVLLRELGLLYQAFAAGNPSPLAELPVQYADFAVWQRNWLQGNVLERQLSYWKKQLSDTSPLLAVPTDYLRAGYQNYQGASQSLELPPNLTAALYAFHRREGVTLFMTLLAAFQVLLARYSGQEDIVVGAPIANRNRTEIEEVIGFFVNTLVLRTDLSGDPTFRDVLGQVRKVALDAYDHQDLPFEKLVQELHPERSLGRNPLFEILFNCFERQTPVALAGLTCEEISLEHATAKFPLTIYVRNRENALQVRLVYQCALFSAERMACLLDQFRHLLEQVVAAPDQRIRSYSLVSPATRSLIPDPTAPLAEPTYESVTTMFTSWVERSPDQPAIRQGGQSWTYKELADTVHTLAHTLFAKGFQRGDVVAVCGPRSFGLIAGILAVFVRGGVLLTLDHRLPVQRRNLMLREAKAKWLLDIGNKQTTVDWVRDLSFPQTIGVDQNTGRSEQQENDVFHEASPFPILAPDDPAYIFFTSGTTGTPKGVLGCHKGLGHFLTWQRKTFAVGPQDRCAQLMGISFDAVLRDVFLPLTSGATLCLPAGDDGLASDRILPWLEREGISLLHIVPSVAHAWLDALPPGVTLSALRRLFFVGEPLTAALVRRWRQTFPQAGGIINLYGPTETTLVKCFYQVPAEEFPGVQPVGWPLPETQALVLAENDRLCGIGEAGEIVLRTPFCSLGYINAPDEQHRRFVRNPWRDDAGDLLYYTGDGGRYRPDGSLEILGRLDHQVKIRGVRIEPDEVTAILLQHPGVNTGVVVARKDEQGQDSLVAYVVPARQQELGPTELRAYLSKHLLVEMVPSAFVFLDSLPLTPNGKVDRKALPAPAQVGEELEEGYVSPRTPAERITAGIWAEVLKLRRIGIYDNFFDLGGHSLLATQVISRVREAFQMDMPLHTIFEKPTVEELTMVIMEKLSERGSGEEVARILAEMESLSEDEARRLIAEESGTPSRGELRD